MCPARRECLGNAGADLGLISNSGRKKGMSGEEGGRREEGKEGP